MTQQILTANRLHDGAVVYLAADQGWTRNIESGLPSDPENTEALIQAAEKAVEAQIIIAPYLIDVEIDDKSIRPLRFREKIRAKGPTILSPAPK